MGIFDGILGAVAGPLLGGLFGSAAQERTNEQNVNLSRETMAWNAEQAQINRDFQERMSGTAYQRAVDDLSKANLNPMLAYGQGGASSPAGNMAVGQAPRVESTAAASIAASQLAANLRLADKEVEKKDAEIDLMDKQGLREVASAGQLTATEENIRQEMTNFPARVRELLARTTNIDTDTLKKMTEAELNRYAFYHLKPAELQLLQEKAAKLQRESRLLDLKVPEAVREAAYWNGPRGEHGMNTRHAGTWDKAITNAVGDTAQAADWAARRATSAAQEHFRLKRNERDFHLGGSK
jgi:hypothetical protein